VLRGLFATLLLGLPMHGEELKVDHATVAGRDLRAMQKALEGVGIKSEYGGPHSNHATEMALVSFPDGSYLELIAIQPHADPKAVAAHEWRKFLEGDGGPCAWAVRPADLAHEVARLRKAGIKATEPARNGRKRPDGAQLDWETAQVGAGNGNFFPFLIHDFSPRERRAYPSGKPTTDRWTGIAKVVIAVRDLDASIQQFRSAYGLAAPERQDDPSFGAKLAWFKGTPVVLATPLSSKSWLEERLRRFGEAPCAFVLALNHVVDVHDSPRWFGRRVVWFDSAKLGWHLGFEAK
jgi:Glyoxalase-like domain